MSYSRVWRTIAQHKLFAAVYIFGTALALASTTVAVVVMNSLIAPVYPEYNRLHSAFISRITMYVPDGGSVMFGLSHELVRDHIYNLENAEKVSAYTSPYEISYSSRADGGVDFPVTLMGVDPAFFDVYSFRFRAGRPVSEAEFEAGLPVAVIGENMARQALGAGDAEGFIGQTVTVDFTDYRVVGVVKEATAAQTDSYADIYVPYSSAAGFDDTVNGIPWIGDLRVVFVTDDIDALRGEIAALAARFNSSHEGYEVDFYDQPVSHITKTFRPGIHNTDYKLSVEFLVFGLVIAALLLIPSLNLSGIISGHMESCMAETGLRKSFGATRGRLLRDVLGENLRLTLIGGVTGYIFAWMMLRIGVADLFISSEVEATEMTGEMIFSPIVFVSVFLICTILNAVSGLIPVYRSLRRPVVESLNDTTC